MQKFVGRAADAKGAPVGGVTITVNVAGGSAASIFSDNGVTAKANPFLNNNNGTFEYYAADGRYDIVPSKTGMVLSSILDFAMSDPLIGTHGECRLTFVSATTLRLVRQNGRSLRINGASQSVPSAGSDLSASGLLANTVYFVYAFMSGATVTLEASTTAPATHTDGVRIKTGDATRTLVGRARTNGSSQFFSVVGGAVGVMSWFHPVRYLRSDVVYFQDPIGVSLADTAGAFATLGNAVSAGYWLQVPFPGSAKIAHARFSVVWSTSNTGNKVRLQHADDGPANIVGIVDLSGDGGSTPIHSASDVTSTIQGLQAGGVFKHVGVVYAKVNATSFTLYRIWLEVLWEADGDPF